MTNPDYTAVALLIDRSGSMAKVADDAKGGIAAFLKDQRALSGKITVRISQFDDRYDEVCKSTPVADVADPDLLPRGMTALLDSWGRLLTDFGVELAQMAEHDRPAHVVFVVITDGFENASREWSRERLFSAVTEQREKWGWEFLYLGADQDAIAVGAQYGVPSHSTMSYSGDAHGTQSAYAAASASVTRAHTTGSTGGVFAPEGDG